MVQRSPVSGLGYMRVCSGLTEEWRTFATGALGAAADVGPDGALLVRMDDRIARFVVTPGAGEEATVGPQDEVVVGWECPSEEDWQRAAAAVEKAGITTAAVAETAWHSEAFACTDPSGTACEFFYGGKVDPATHFVSPLGASFVMGAQGLGHVTIATAQCREAVEFYHDILGFQVRETNRTGPERSWRWAFLSPNMREHSVAFMNVGGPRRIMHVLVEVSELDAVGRAMDRCLDGRAPMTVSLGRHWNDEMVSFYLRTPSGFDIEYGYGGRQVDAQAWTRRVQGGSGAVSLWGHRIVRPDGTLGRQIGSPG